MKPFVLIRCLAVLQLLLTSGLAHAAGFQLLEQNASGLGNAYAGSAAVAENAATVFFNPAGMTRLETTEFSAGVTPILTSFKFHNNGSSIGFLGNAGEGGDAGGWAFVPNAYLSHAMTPDLFVGIGLSVPFGLKTEYDEPWLGGAQAILFDVKTVNLNPSIAYRINQHLSVGAGLNYMRMDAEYQRVAAVASTAAASTKVILDVDGDAYGWNMGALLDVTDSTRVGLSYRSSVKHTLEGNLNFAGPAAGASASTTPGSAQVNIKLPSTIIASVAHKLSDDWLLLGDASYTEWSSIQRVNIVRTSGALSGQTAQTLDALFEDSWRFALGATLQINQAWKLKLGTAYDQTPVRGADSRLVSLPDNDRLWASVGAQWAAGTRSTLDLGLAYLFIEDAEIDNNQSASPDFRGRVKGSYDGRVIILGLQFSMAF